MLAGLAYTGGPWPYGYHGLGEPFVFVFFGVVAVAGTYYLQTDEVTGLALAASLPVAMTVTAILVVNNLRDIESDRRAGKRTLAALLGDWPTRAEYAVLIVLPFALVGSLAMAEILPPWSWLSWLALPLALALARAVMSGTKGKELNLLLKRTSQLHLLLGGLLALGLAL